MLYFNRYTVHYLVDVSWIILCLSVLFLSINFTPMIVENLIEIPVFFEDSHAERIGSVVIKKEYLEYFPHWNITAEVKKIGNGQSTIQAFLLPSDGAIKLVQKQMKHIEKCKCT